MSKNKKDAIVQRVNSMMSRVSEYKQAGLYFYNQPISEFRGGSKVLVNGKEMGMYASYSYLGLIGHPRINSAALPPAQAAAANEAFKVILDEPWRIE